MNVENDVPTESVVKEGDPVDQQAQRVANVLQHARLMEMLLQSEKFQTFFELNYTLVKNTDPETNEVSLVLVDRPDADIAADLTSKMKKAVTKRSKKVELFSPEMLRDLERKSGKGN